MTTASEASELVASQYGSANYAGGQDGEQGGKGNTINSASSCPIKGGYDSTGKLVTESTQTECFKINFCDFVSCGYKNVSYTCSNQVDSRGRIVRRNLGNSCRVDPIKDVAALCGCPLTPTTAPSPSPSPSEVPISTSPSVTVPPPSPSPTEVVACKATLTGFQGDRNSCLQEPGQTTVRYTKVKCEKNGVVTEKQLTCGAREVGGSGSCCNMSTFTQRDANNKCGCPN